MNDVNKEYGAGQIQVRWGLEAVRKRPACYIGSTDARGSPSVYMKLWINSIDEALAGYCHDYRNHDPVRPQCQGNG